MPNPLRSRLLQRSKRRRQRETIFTTQTGSVGTGGPYELGMQFKSAVSGQILAIRFRKTTGDNVTHTGKIWTESGTQLTSITFTGETSSGWQEQALPSPLTIAANTIYVVSVNSAANSFEFAAQGFNAQIVSGNLIAPVGAGVFANSPGVFPNSSFNNSNYFRDLVFIAA